MKVYIWPTFGKESGQGGIKRVWEAQHKYLPDFDVQIVSELKQADVINIHADDIDTKGVPTAYSCHGLYWAGYDWQKWSHEANHKIIKAMKRAEAVSTPSRFVSNSLARGMLLNPFTLYHGVDISEWEPVSHKGYVLWAKTRLDSICDPTPVNRLAQYCPEVPFYSTFGNADLGNMTIFGKLNFQDTKRLIKEAAVYLATVMETGGITVLEAMAAGVPPLGFRHGVNTEIIQHKENGYLVEPGDYSGLVEGLHYVLKNRAELSANARQTVIDNFQWKDRIKDYLSFYQAALHGKSDSPKISVVITAYKLEDYLPACIESVLSQTFNDWELIIVDDASPDRCGEIADHYAQHDSRIKVIHNRTNAYLAEARNIGIRASRGEYIIPLDADDRFGPNTLRVFSETLDKNRDVDIVNGDFWLVEPDGREWKSDWPVPAPKYSQQIRQRNQVYYASMYRKWVWERTGGYRRRMKSAEDAEFWTRAMSYGAVPVKLEGFPTLIYANRPGSMSHTIATPNWTQWFIWSKYAQFTPFSASDHPKGGFWPVLPYGPALTTVVIPVGPGHDWYLQDCLDSLVSQTMQNWEVIVVNDTGVKWLEEGRMINPYLQGYPFIRVIDSEGSPRGPAWARNQGIREVNTESFVLLDADDFAQPLFLDVLYKAWKEHGGWVYTDWTDQLGNHKQARDWDSNKFVRKMLGPSTGIYSKADWELVGGFDEQIAGWEDWEFQLALFNRGICGMRIAYPGFTYRYDTGQQREGDFAQKELLLQYIETKYRKIYEDRNHMAGCSSCGGRVRTTPRVQQESVGSAPSNDMVLMEYVGPQTQEVSFRSKVRHTHKYTYSKTRKFYAYKEDVEWITRNKFFRVVQEVMQNVSISEAPVLTAETRPAPKAVLVEDLKLNDPLLVNVLKKNKLTVDDLVDMSDGELLAITGIGPSRVEKIRKAIKDAFQ